MSYTALTEKKSGFPYLEQLTERSGKIKWVKEHKYGIKFSFFNDNTNFEYPSKARGHDIVKNALKYSKGKIITILYEHNDSHSPIFSNKNYHNVFEIKVDGILVRSYFDSEKAWKSDSKLLPFIAIFFLIGGPYIWWALGRKADA